MFVKYKITIKLYFITKILNYIGGMRESNPRPPAPKAGIIPLDQYPTYIHIYCF